MNTTNSDLIGLIRETKMTNPFFEKLLLDLERKARVLNIIDNTVAWVIAGFLAVVSFIQNGLSGQVFQFVAALALIGAATRTYCVARVRTARYIDELCAYMRREPLQVVEILNSGMPVERIMAKEHIANHHTPRVRKILSRLGIQYQQEKDEWKTLCGNISTFTR